MRLGLATPNLATRGAIEPEHGRWLAWWRARGPATQAAVPGIYAWAVTIAPLGLGPSAATASAVFGFGLLVACPLLERRAPNAARLALGWGLVAAALVTWAVAPERAVAAFDATRGLAGMLGWALFAFAVASPARSGVAEAAGPAPVARRPPRRADMLGLTVALAMAAGLELPGWQGLPRDRALLVRLVAVAGGIALVATASTIGVGRPVGSGSARRRRRLRAIDALWAALACALMGAGVAFHVWGGQ